MKVTVLQDFEDFVIEIFIQIHSFDDAKNLQNSIVPLLSFLGNISASKRRLTKLGTFKEVSKTIVRNFERYWSLRSKIHFSFPWG